MFTRLKQHLKEDYWNDCIAVISKDNLLNKAHVKYLENKFYNIAQDTGRANVLNSSIPTCSSISEYDEAMLSEFISNTKLLVNTLGYKTFDSIEDSSIKAGPKQLLFYIKGARGASSKGVIVPDGFAVFKDSQIASSTVPSMSAPLIKLRTSLIEKGIIDENKKADIKVFNSFNEAYNDFRKDFAKEKVTVLLENDLPDTYNEN